MRHYRAKNILTQDAARTYGCCGGSEETDRDGVTTTDAYDEFKRVSHTVRDGITTLYSYDALGNQTSVTVKGRNDAEITTSSTYSDGELASATDALGNVTAYTRTYATDGDNTTYTETVTKPDGSIQITVSKWSAGQYFRNGGAWTEL